MVEPRTSAEHETWLGWIPLPAIVLAADGSAFAVNSAWASVLGTDGGRWLDVVEPRLRPGLLARLRQAAAAGEPGSADCPVTSPGGLQWSRWWWRPVPPQNLVVCVGVIGHGRVDGVPPMHADLRDPPAPAAAPADHGISIGPDVAMAAINRIFEAGLALESAASLLDGPLEGLAQHAITDLDELISRVRHAIFRQRAHLVDQPPGQGPETPASPSSA
jgi:hypothetical protein